MKVDNAEAIADFMESEGVDVTVHYDYSGRGMYNKTTTGVVTKNLADVVYAMGRLNIEDRRRVDSMGLDTIVY